MSNVYEALDKLAHLKWAVEEQERLCNGIIPT